jgi:2'-5' RNA ligase
MPDQKGLLREARADRKLRRHWTWRPDWTRERRLWWWYLTFESDREVQRLAAEARTAIRRHAPVQIVPARWLHLTLAEVGHVNAIPRRVADECARLTGEYVADLAPIDLQVGRITTMSGAIVLPVSATGLEELHDRLIAALHETLPQPPVQRRFEPHVTVAYVDRDCRRADVLDDEIVETCEPGRSSTDRVSLAEVSRDQRHYRWTSRCEVSLRGPQPRDGGQTQ